MSIQVHDMFSRIASRYDLANTVLSFGIHHLWRKKAVKESRPDDSSKVLDLCTGTGDLAQQFKTRIGPGGFVIGLDFVEGMLKIADKKYPAVSSFVRGDALNLPFNDSSFDIVSISFGIRNVDDVSRCLSEMGRILVKGGRAVILEFGQPGLPIWGSIYRTYSRYIMPMIGGLITGDRAAYEYLPETSARFPCGERFQKIMEQANFTDVTVTPLFGGIAFLYVGTKK